MEIERLQKRAAEIRNLYARREMEKFGKKWTNAQIAQGFVGDVGDLMKLVMAKEGVREIEDVDDKLAHELADCLYCVLLLSERYGVNVEEAFEKAMNEIEKGLEKQKEEVI
jgi:NTP pyrophosphatase (non-canonical NTP hydrolase)